MHDWVSLSDRMAATTESPSLAQLRAVLEELFESAPDDEHPDCWIECGTDDGPLYSLAVFQDGSALYTKYSDVDMSETLEELELAAPDVDAALALWQRLIDGRLDFSVTS